MGGAVNKANHLQHWGFVTLFALWGNHFLPSAALQGSDGSRRKILSSMTKSNLSCAKQLALSRPVDLRWVWRNHARLMERDRVSLQHISPSTALTGESLLFYLSPVNVYFFSLPNPEDPARSRIRRLTGGGRRAGWLFVRESAGLWLPTLALDARHEVWGRGGAEMEGVGGRSGSPC